MIGRVVQAGKGSMTYGISDGDRVCAINFDLGGHAKYVIVPCYELIKVPPKVDSAHAVCLLRPYVTAFQCLHDAGDHPVMAGDRVLVIGGTGACGFAFVELAIAAGARAVYATGRGDNIKELLRAKGATILGREPEEWLPAVEGRMDIVIDLVCSDGYASSYKALRRDGVGKLVCVGAIAKQNQNDLIMGNLAASTSLTKAAYFMPNTTTYDFFDSLENDPQGYRDDLRDLFRLLKEKRISPRISKFILLDEIADAHEAIERGGMNGHVICRPNPTKKFVYKKVKQPSEARDDVPFLSGGGSDSEDETQYSHSIIANMSGDSAFSGSYTTFDDLLTIGYSESTLGTSTFSTTFGFLSSHLKNIGKEKGRGVAAGDIAVLGAVAEGDKANGSPRSSVVDASAESCNCKEEEAADRATQDNQDKDQSADTAYANDGETPTTKQKKGYWLNRIPSFSRKKEQMPAGTAEEDSEMFEDSRSPIASEEVIARSSEGAVSISSLPRESKSHKKSCAGETADTHSNVAASVQNPTNPDGLLSYMISFFATGTEESTKGSGGVPSGEDAATPPERADGDQETAAGSVSSALKDLLGINMCANQDDLDGVRTIDAMPVQIFVPEDKPAPSAFTAGTIMRSASCDSGGSDGSSTFITTGTVLPRHVETLLSQGKAETVRVSALSGMALAPQIAPPRDDDNNNKAQSSLPARVKGLKKSKAVADDDDNNNNNNNNNSNNSNKAQPPPAARVKGLMKSTAVPMSRTVSARSQNKVHRRQSTHTSHISLARSNPAVSIRCDTSQRQFHVPASVASSVMSVSVSTTGASSALRGSSRNIYAARTRHSSRTNSSQRFPSRGKATKVSKGVFKKK